MVRIIAELLATFPGHCLFFDRAASKKGVAVVRALDLATGSARWSFEAPEEDRDGFLGTPRSHIVVSDKHHVFASTRRLYKFDRDGRVIWRKQIPGVEHGPRIYTQDEARLYAANEKNLFVFSDCCLGDSSF